MYINSNQFKISNKTERLT